MVLGQLKKNSVVNYCFFIQNTFFSSLCVVVAIFPNWCPRADAESSIHSFPLPPNAFTPSPPCGWFARDNDN